MSGRPGILGLASSGQRYTAPMRVSLAVLASLTLALSAGPGCNSARKTSPAATEPAAATPSAAAGPSANPDPASAAGAPAAETFGAKLQSADAVALAQILSRPDQFANQTVTVEAQVRKACTRKGCWMELAESTRDGTPGCRVTFKDYGFFVPLDSAGARARVQGKVEVDTLSAAAVRHYEEEGAAFAKAPDGTAREIRIVATGVELTRPANKL